MLSESLKKGEQALQKLIAKPENWFGVSKIGNKFISRPTHFPVFLAGTLNPSFKVPENALRLPASGRGNYWVGGSLETQSEPYPDDLDDTALLIGLRARQGLLAPEEQASFVQLLISLEETPGGPYRTWCSNEATWHDVDPVVNANAAWALSQCGVFLPGLQAFVADAFYKDVHSPYYANQWVTRFLLLRIIPPVTSLYVRQLLKKDPPQGPLSLAAAILCCAYTQLPTDQLKTKLVTLQSPHGSWLWEPLVIEKAGSNPVFSGSMLATTGFALAALSFMPQQPKQQRQYPAYIKVTKDLRGLPDLLVVPFRPILATLTKGDPEGRLAGIARTFRQVSGLAVSEQVIDLLEQATVWGWLAYTLADNQLDGEAGPNVLPSIQWATRRCVQLFVEAAGEGFLPAITGLLDRVDAANAWELTHARLTNPSQAAFPPGSERSIGHALGPLAVLHAAGISQNDPHFLRLEKVLSAYLTFRQHLDDAHDWREDQEGGIRTPIGDCLRANVTNTSIKELRKAFTKVGVPFVVSQGVLFLSNLTAARLSLPADWQPFLKEEEERFAQSLQVFSDAVAFVSALSH